MKGLLNCEIYFAITGLLGFLAGRAAPKSWFCYDHFPYRSFAFEQDGRLYDRLKIKNWLHKIPDMSRVFPGMPAKKIAGKPTWENLCIMLRETCVAECIHGILNVTGILCFFICDSGWCIVLYVV